MTHNEQRTNWWKEGIAGLISGALYGISNAIVGNPFDSIKTRMQVLNEYQNLSMTKTAQIIYRSEGINGFFRGVVPSMIGSGTYRSIQFALFESIYTKLNNKNFFNLKIPYTLGLEPRVVIAGAIAGTVRAIFECPFEFSKVRLQVGKNWSYSELYHGFYVLWLRSTGIITVYFTSVDIFRRNTNLYNSQIGLFLMNGICSIIAWISMWPIEIAKNEIQSNYNSKFEKPFQIIKNRVREKGFINGLYKGTLPGILGIFIRSGAAMIVMLKTQKLITYLGFRK